MAKYKIEFSGFAYVEADSKEEAHEAWLNDECIYLETGVNDISEIEEFDIEV